ADWPLRILPFTAHGAPKTAEAVPTDIAGPACFSGDLLARDRMLPRLDAGDLVAVPETGAYYFSNPFSYNLLPAVPVYGYRTTSDGGVEWALIRRRQSVDRVLPEPRSFASGAWVCRRIYSSSNDSADREFEGLNDDLPRIPWKISHPSLR